NKTPATLAETTTTLTNPETHSARPLLPLTAQERADIEAEVASPAPVQEIWPLTPLQEGLLFHVFYDEGKADPYVMQAPLALNGALDKEALRAAFQQLLNRHVALRAAFVGRRSGKPVQVIPAEVTLPWRELDFTDTPDERTQKRRIDELLHTDRRQGFDPAAPPMMRVTLVRLGDERHALVLTSHHVIWDGWSMAQSLTEVFELYA
ncbi:condensation domain-containing protein, partial [Streptomyces sp. KLOTTS4A1]|uniref:condensation domain-containing protein n=1 Tax=Streptomyces sp. KLOTTS4A1 TaxID=3390996 RepID=UPI0039F4DAED